MVTSDQVYAALRQVHDPEIPVNIVDLGLVYNVQIEDESIVRVTMTLTTPGCGMAQQIATGAKQAALTVPGVTQAWVTVVWDPKWDPSRMSPAAKQQLGMA